jgi:hypothetical protein
MLISFLHDRSTPKDRAPQRPDDLRALTDYMEAAVVTKHVNGVARLITRDPVPEVLCGSAPVLRREIASLTFERKFRFALLSFDPSDIDVAAFNAGDLSLRRAVDSALRVVFDGLWPGIPQRARPHVFATTHTHVGRLEVNIAFARAVFPEAGRPRSLNPDPPTPYGEPPRYWRACRDMLNHRFGWADPEDPARRQLIMAPDWQTKEIAEALRAGEAPAPLPYEPALDVLNAAATAGTVRSRADVVACLNDNMAPSGWSVLSITDKTVTIGPPDAPVSERVRLGGAMMSASFGGKPDAAEIAQAQAARARVLREAAPQFADLLATRAAYNRKTYGFSLQEAPYVLPAQWLDDAPRHVRTLIPARHHLMALNAIISAQQETPIDEAVHDRPEVSRSDAPDRDRPEAGDRHLARTDRSSGSPDGGASHPDHRAGGQLDTASRALDALERHAERLSGPIGWVAILTSRINRLRNLLPAATRLLITAYQRPLYQPALIARLTTLIQNLETLNDPAHALPDPDAGPDDSDLAPAAGDPVAGNASVGSDARSDRASAETGGDDGAFDPRARRVGHSSRSDRGPADAEPYDDGDGSEQRQRSDLGHQERGTGARGPESPDRGVNNPPAQPDLIRPPLAQVLQCARGIAQAFGPGGKLSRQAGGFIYQDPANLIVVWNGQVVYGLSDMDDNALCARLAPALNAAGYALHPRTGPLREHSIIATIPGAQVIDLSAERVDPATDDASAPETEAEPEAHDPSPLGL